MTELLSIKEASVTTKNSIIYSLCIEDLQNDANIYLGRNLNEDEIIKACKKLQFGLGENLTYIYSTIFNEF